MSVTNETEIIVELANRPGTLGEAAEVLANANVNILGFLLQEQGSTGTFRFITDDPDEATRVLGAGGFDITTAETVLVTVPHEPGQLANVASRLGKSGVNIESGFPVVDPASGDVSIGFAVDDVASATKVLSS